MIPRSYHFLFFLLTGYTSTSRITVPQTNEKEIQVSSRVVSNLDILKPASKKWINSAVLSRFWDSSEPEALVKRDYSER